MQFSVMEKNGNAIVEMNIFALQGTDITALIVACGKADFDMTRPINPIRAWRFVPGAQTEVRMIADEKLTGRDREREKKLTPMITVIATVVGETEKGVLLNNGAFTNSFPKSQIEIYDNGTVSMPAWLAKAQGFTTEETTK
jgi:hypothetical protein